MKIANISLAIAVAPVAAMPALAAKRTAASPFSQDLLPLLPHLTLSPTTHRLERFWSSAITGGNQASSFNARKSVREGQNP
jgi:hypothetical protein